jgi:hypothetical protein
MQHVHKKEGNIYGFFSIHMSTIFAYKHIFYHIFLLISENK